MRPATEIVLDEKKINRVQLRKDRFKVEVNKYQILTVHLFHHLPYHSHLVEVLYPGSLVASGRYEMVSVSPSNLSARQTLLLTALTASLATTAAILSFQALRREHRTERLKKQVGEDVSEWERTQGKDDEEDLEGLSAEERAERWANGDGLPVGGGRRREWEDGEFDESLIREQVRTS